MLMFKAPFSMYINSIKQSFTKVTLYTRYIKRDINKGFTLLVNQLVY